MSAPDLAIATAAADPLTLVLEGRLVRLEPMARAHRDRLLELALDPELWRWTLTRLATPADLDGYIETALQLRDTGEAIPFVTVERATGRPIGCTRFGNIDRANRRLEIGWSWLGRGSQRRGFNTEAKRLMLGHAFERMGCIRVEFRVNAPNAPSHRAVEGLGAVREGTLRHHQVAPDGRLLDWVYYSILRDEWPAVRDRLDARLAAHAGA